jgi:hypothetical protein
VTNLSSLRWRILAVVTALIPLGLLGSLWWQGSASDDSRQKGDSGTLEGATMDEMNLMVPASDLETLTQRAIDGDNDSARRLAQHYFQLDQKSEERRWLELAARRGDCAAIDLLYGGAVEAGNLERASHWNGQLRQNACTGAKAYPNLRDPRLRARPLWKD